MKNYLLPILLFIQYISLFSQSDKLWYTAPADFFEEALPIGNGKIGAMVYGKIDTERLSLNDITLWSGEPVNPYHNPEAYKNLPAVRKALFNEDYAAADTLVRKLQGNFSNAYQPLGNLIFEFNHKGPATDYKRILDLSKSQAAVRYKVGNTIFSRIYIASHPDQLIDISLTSKGPDKLNFTILMNSPLKYHSSIEKNQIILQGNAPVRSAPNYLQVRNAVEFIDDRGTRFIGILRINKTDGTIKYTDTSIQVTNATLAELRLSMATSFNGFDKDPFKNGKDEKKIATTILENAAKYSFNDIIGRHEKDYTSLYNRVKFDLGVKANEQDTYTRIKSCTPTNTDIGLIPLYFNYGRYLIISSSRTPFVPMNLQGLWNESIRPPWSSNYTININTEMNYWPVEVCNLSELHQPLLSFISNLSKTGAITAKTYYQADGWVAHHNSDIWAMSNPVGDFGKGSPQWANWPMGGAWLSTHLYEHYRYTLDQTFLKEVYPLLKGAALFCLEYLVPDSKGYLVTAPSTSPENVYITDKGFKASTLYGSTSDLALIREIFNDNIFAANTLNIEASFVDSLQKALLKIYPYQVSKQGHLQEWYHDWDDVEITHRHLSHLIGVFPGNSINLNTPKELEAAKKSLLRRTNNGTGWSISWKISMWARLLDGEKSYDAIQKLLTYYPADNNETKYAGGGTFPNLFDAHPPFQIDGNFGGIAGIAEMLLQSHMDYIQVLPALPKVWKNGTMNGLKARDNITVNISWKNNKLKKAQFLSTTDLVKKIKYNDKTKEVRLPKNIWVSVKF